jgi:GNAT superfamily N-acetyltransferase
MTAVLHLRKVLLDPPVAREVLGIGIRPIRLPDDVPAWLALRERATADLSPRPRTWHEQDFAAEMLAKPWWRNDYTWLAAAAKPHENDCIGAVTLAVREGAVRRVPVIHWLLVDPEWRRRGVGRLLVGHLEQTAWNAGWRELELETHSGWSAAVRLYRAMGYERL